MKKYSLVIFALVAAFNIGCQPKNNQKTRVTARAVRGGVTPTQAVAPTTSTTTPEASGKQWGQVVQFSNQSQQQFQAGVAGLISNLAEPDGTQALALGTVSGRSGDTTGVRFWGSVARGANGQITDGALRISIVDNYVGQTNSAGEAITEIPIYIASGVEGFAGVSGQMNGNSARVTFSDSYGSITLDGQVSGQWFVGNMYYANSFLWNGQRPGAQGTLGYFAVPVCGFFACQ